MGGGLGIWWMGDGGLGIGNWELGIAGFGTGGVGWVDGFMYGDGWVGDSAYLRR